MLIGSLVELHVNCIHVCVFHISKNCFLKLARHLLDTLLSVELLQLFLIVIPTASRHLVDRSSFSSCVFALFLDTFFTAVSVDVIFLDTFLNRLLNTSRHLYLSRITEDLFICFLESGSHFFDLSQSVHTCSFPKHLSLSLQSSPQ